MIIIVQWDNDGTVNTVSRKDVSVIGGGRLVVNSRIKMWWGEESRWYKGVVLDVKRGGKFDDECDEQDGDDSEDDDSQDDIPLSSLAQAENLANRLKAAVGDDLPVDEDILALDDSVLSEAVKKLNSSSFLEENLENDDNGIPPIEGSIAEAKAIDKQRHEDIEQSASDNNDDDSDDPNDPDYEPDEESESQSILKPHVKILTQPENFTVEGEQRQPLNDNILSEPSKAKSRRLDVKESRLKGAEYYSESGVHKNARNQLKSRCSSIYCSRSGLGCEIVSDERRQQILSTFYGLASLTDQRLWLSRHLKSKKVSSGKENSRKSRTISYFLPIDDNGDTVRVCRLIFVNTLNVTDRQISTVLKKTTSTGEVEPEKRGGRSTAQTTRDARVRQLVKDHINRFPRMESHYNRSHSTSEYLSDELTITKMFDMYNKNHQGVDSVNVSFYYKVFKSMNLKFSRPKKDLCGICEDYRKASVEEKQFKQQEYETHIKEKEEVRRIKNRMKEQSEEEEFVGCFDLQQVILLPRSDRGELFYKRRLSNYNFSIYDLKSRKGYCYLWHEGIGKRGANEIGSNLADFLRSLDSEGKQRAFLFCDGCGGQNKNSIICAMILDVIAKAKNLSEIIIHFFETNHGQSEGDAIHSVIERAMKRVGELIVPGQLSLLIRMASKTPYKVIEVKTEEIMDYKSLSQSLGILRARETLGGVEVRWPDIRQLRLLKNKPKSIYLKFSHTEKEFHELQLPNRRSECVAPLQYAYKQPPTVPEAKFQDLMSLCTGPHPVVKKPEYITFFKSLNPS